MEKIVTLRDFVNYVDGCAEEASQIPIEIFGIIAGARFGSYLVVEGIQTANTKKIMGGIGSFGFSAEEALKFKDHFNNANNAKTAQKNAEILSEVL